MRFFFTIVALSLAILSADAVRAETAVASRTVEVEGLKLFYREAGSPSRPTLILLHGNPSSSFMFRELIPRLAAHFHVLAPDYPGYGYSDRPTPAAYDYSFDHLARTMDGFAQKVGAKRYILYMQDYGGPVGFRLALAHPERVDGIIVQNANAYLEGLNPEWREELEKQNREGVPPKPPAPESVTSFEDNLKWIAPMYLTGARDPETMARDGYSFDAAMLSRPGQDSIQDALDADYHTNLTRYPAWQDWLRIRHPPTLVLWGDGDKIFGVEGAKAYKRDVPEARIRLFRGGHFMLEEYSPEVAAEIIRMFAHLRS